MTTNDRFEEGILAGLVLSTVIFLTLMAVLFGINASVWRSEIIQNGNGRYNATTGIFEHIPHTTVEKESNE